MTAIADGAIGCARVSAELVSKAARHAHVTGAPLEEPRAIGADVRHILLPVNAAY